MESWLLRFPTWFIFGFLIVQDWIFSDGKADIGLGRPPKTPHVRGIIWGIKRFFNLELLGVADNLRTRVAVKV